MEQFLRSGHSVKLSSHFIHDYCHQVEVLSDTCHATPLGITSQLFTTVHALIFGLILSYKRNNCYIQRGSTQLCVYNFRCFSSPFLILFPIAVMWKTYSLELEIRLLYFCSTSQRSFQALWLVLSTTGN